MCATRTCASYRRAFWIAVAARSARSCANAKSSSVKRRPLSALTSVSAPSVCSPARIGTTITERMPIARIAASCSGSVIACSSSSSGISAYSSGGPPRSTPGTPLGAFGIGRVAAAQVLGHRDLRRVDVRQRDLLDAALLVGHVDRAPVRQPRHRELRDPLERLLVVEARREQLAGLGQEALALLGLLGVRDVLDDVHGEVAALVFEQRRLGQQPVAAPGLAVDAAREQLRRGLAGDQPAARQVLDLDRRPVLLGDHEARGELARAGGRDLVRRAPGRAAARRPRWRRRSGPRRRGR